MGVLAQMGEDRVQVKAHTRQRPGFAAAAAEATQRPAPVPPNPNPGRGPLAYLPAALSAAGSFGGPALVAGVAGPLGVGAAPAARMIGSAAGGGLGELGAEALSGEPINARQILRQAMLQGSLQGIGEVATPVASAGGKLLMGNALKVGSALRGRFPNVDIPATALEQRLPIGVMPRLVTGPTGAKTVSIEGGARTAERLVKQSGAVETALRQQAGQQGTLFDVQQALVQPRIDEVNQLRYTANRPPLTPVEEQRIARTIQNTVKNAIADRTSGAVRSPAVQLTPEELHWVEQYAQKNSKTAFTDATTGQVRVSVDPILQSTARNARAALVTPGLIPGLAEQSATTQRLRALNQAVRAREYGVPGQNVFERVGERVASYGTLGALGGGTFGAMTGSSPEDRIVRGLLGAGAGWALGSPQAMSLAALGLTDPYFQMLLQQAPRLAQAATVTP